MLLIGLGCQAQVGKDTAADYLEKKFPGQVIRVSFADKLKKIAIDLFGLSHEQCYGDKQIKEKVDSRYGLSPREILQGMGEKMREIHPSIWVDTVFNTTIPELQKKGYNCFVVSDVRYPNEADKIHEQGGWVVRIDRLSGGTSVGANHSSETAMEGYSEFDFTLENNSTLEEYYEKLDKLMEALNYNGRTKRGNKH